MFKTIKTTIGITAFVAGVDQDSRRYRKERKARLADAKAHDAMIAASQAKIGPYKPATIPVQVWA